MNTMYTQSGVTNLSNRTVAYAYVRVGTNISVCRNRYTIFEHKAPVLQVN